MPLRIAFDLDGVLADMDSALARCVEALREEAAERTAAADRSPQKRTLSARHQRRLWEHIESTENFWETLEELEPGAIARLAAVAAERRWEILFLTMRPPSAGSTAQVQTQRWLASKGFPFPSVFVVQGSRGRIAAALDLDVVVDDRPENCLDVVTDSRARAVLVWRDKERQPPAEARRLGIGVVGSVAECLDALTGADTPDTDRPGLMARLKRALGLKETPAAS